MTSSFYLTGKKLPDFECDSNFKPFVDTFGRDYKGRVKQEQIDNFVSQCKRYFQSLTKAYPELTFEELIDIDTMIDLMPVIETLKNGSVEIR